jgi:hypothetical protein
MKMMKKFMDKSAVIPLNKDLIGCGLIAETQRKARDIVVVDKSQQAHALSLESFPSSVLLQFMNV